MVKLRARPKNSQNGSSLNGFFVGVETGGSDWLETPSVKSCKHLYEEFVFLKSLQFTKLIYFNNNL